MQDTELSLAF